MNHDQILDDLRGANLIEADLYRADLRGADLRGADLRGADLYRADLREADLNGADLQWANLARANLREADLNGADLYRANLREADLNGADLRGADLYRADLAGAKGIMQISGFDARGYALIRWFKGKETWFNSGCRSFSLATALVHWGSEAYADRERGQNYVAAIKLCVKLQELNDESRRK